MKKSRIAWTGVTWNPVTGCDKVSAGCDNCYAVAEAAKAKLAGARKYQVDGDPRTSGPGFGVTIHEDELQRPFAWTKPRLVFVNSMSDMFHARVPVDFLRRTFDVMSQTPRHTYQILTKRSTRLAKLADSLEWSDNIWMGVTVENSDALSRVDDLRKVPAAVKFLSCEPLLGPLDGLDLTGIDWVITGGESGPNHRPIDPAWVRDIRDLCVANGVAFFHKQWGGEKPKSGGNELDGVVWEQMPQTPAAAALG